MTPDCSFGVQLARRETFTHKKRKKAKKKNDEFKEAFGKIPIIRTMSIYNNGTTKIYPMVKTYAGSNKDEIEKIRLI